jgi:hypothetical protein
MANWISYLNWLWEPDTIDVVRSDAGDKLRDNLRRLLNRLLGYGLSVKDPKYGATGDGVTDDTIAVNAALLDKSNAGGGEVYFPPGTYIVTTLTRYSNVRLKGSGYGNTVIKLKNGTNADLFIDPNVASISIQAAVGTSSTGGTTGWEICDLTLDGNKANNTSGWCLRAYGYGYRIANVVVRNGASGGMQLDWNGAQAFNADGPESFVENVKVHDCAGIGLQFGGPHDTCFSNVVLFKNNINFHVGPNATALAVLNLHSWSPNTSCPGIIQEAGYCLWSNCEVEGVGGNLPNFVMLGGSSGFAACHFYGTSGSGSANSTGIQLGQSGTTTYGTGNGQVTVTGAKQATGLVIDANFDHCAGTSGAINFANEANNFVRANIFQSAGTYVGGTIGNTTAVEMVVNGLTADGTTGLSGCTFVRLKSNLAFNVSDKAGTDIFNVNTNAGKVEVPNNKKFIVYTSGYSNVAVAAIINGDGAASYGWNNTSGTNDTNMSRAAGGVVKSNGTFADAGVSNAGAITTGSTLVVTVSSVAVGTIRCQPAGAVTGTILAVGSTNGQRVTVFNESAAANSITFAVSGTSNVADGTSSVIAGLTARTFVWNSSTGLWYPAK